ncbi:hypothetical protein GEMRC1_005702 [Eukaryota sp. GEM-RC1]
MENSVNQSLLDFTPKKRGSSSFATSINLCNTVVGAGVLTLANAMMNAGAGTGLVLLSFVCILASASFIFLASCCDLTGEYSYKSFGAKAFGTKYGKYMEAFVFLYTSGTAIGYNVLIGDFLPDITKKVLPSTAPSFLFSRTWLILLIAVIVLLPLTYLPRVKRTPIHLWRGSSLYFTDSFPIPSPDIREPVVWWKFNHDIFLAIPLMSVSYTAHYNVPNLYKELDRPSVKKFTMVVIMGSTFCLLLFASIGTFGYLSFRNLTEGDLLNNYGQHDNLAFAGKVGLAFTIAFSFPLCMFALRRSVENIFFAETKEVWKRQFVLATLLTSAAVSVAILEERIEVILRFSGSTAGSMIVYVLPALFYIRISKKHNSGSSVKRFLAYINVVMGFVFMVFCTWNAWKKLSISLLKLAYI